MKVQKCEVCSAFPYLRHKGYGLATEERCVMLHPEVWMDLCEHCAGVFDDLEIPLNAKKLFEKLEPLVQETTQ